MPIEVEPIKVEQGAFLGVDESAGGRRWRLRLSDDRAALAIAQRLGVPELIARVIAGRGVSPDGAAAYLEPTLRDLMPDPSVLADMDVAVDRFASAVVAGEKIAVFGDYDVDGATSSALIARYLRDLGLPCRVYIPDRISEGYGPNSTALRLLAKEGVALVVTVDCGTAAYEPLADARDAGLDVVVVDHHIAEPQLPVSVAVVNPNRLDDVSGQGALAAVGVTFLFLVAVNRHLRKIGHFGDRPEPNLLESLDIVALGTVCDLVPLTGLNRALVRRGLGVMRRRGNVGLAALADVAGSEAPPDASHLGFILGPRINAGGRVGASDLGYRLLTTNDPEEARDIAARLDRHNAERKAIEAAGFEQALTQAFDLVAGDQSSEILIACGESWHPGVIGLISSRLTERFARPSLVITFDGDRGKGSARSVPGVDIGAAVTAARQAGLLINGGGHPMAAGITVARDKLDALRAFLKERVGRAAAAPSLELDGALTVSGASLDLVETLERAGPFGSGNPEPRFVVSNCRVVDSRVLKDAHVRAILADDSGARLTAMAFRMADRPVGALLCDPGAGPVHVAGRIKANSWRGRQSVQLLVDDAAPAR